jgi:hypothetical protein
MIDALIDSFEATSIIYDVICSGNNTVVVSLNHHLDEAAVSRLVLLFWRQKLQHDCKIFNLLQSMREVRKFLEHLRSRKAERSIYYLLA